MESILSSQKDLPSLQHGTECQDTFDEESCRFFLVEVGKRIVPCYPFNFGIEEVYGSIVQRYGLEQASDAMSVLQELLEDEDNAAGLGDDGDIWRSWRYGWRRRNDDPANPFVPRVGNIVLQPPTLIDARRLKAENYNRRQRSETTFGENGRTESSSPFGSSDLLQGRVHQPHHPLRTHVNGIHPEGLDDTQSVMNVTAPQSSSVSVRDTVPSFISLSKFPLPPTFLDVWDGSEEKVLANTGFGSSYESPASSISHTQKISHKRLPSTISEGDVFPRLIPMRVECDIDELPVTRAVTRETSSQHRTPKTRPSACLDNRKARLIDGRLFNLGNRSSSQAVRDSIAKVETISDHIKAAPGYDIVVDSKPSRRIRGSWLQELRTVFFRQKSASTTAKHSRHQSVPAITRAGSLICGKMSAPQPTKLDISNRNNHFGRFALDGAYDISSSDSSSAVNLNKPLPVSPNILVRHGDQFRDPDFRSLAQNIDFPVSKSSTTSSGIPDKSSKANSHAITSDSFESDHRGTFDLSSINEVDPFGGFDSISGQKRTRPDSWKSIPLPKDDFETLVTRSTALSPPPLDIKRPQTARKSEHISDIPSTQSAAGLQRHARTPERVKDMPTNFRKEPLHYYPRDDAEHEVRHRETHIVQTPKMLHQDTGDDTPAQNSSKRSLSPVKRFFAFGKSDSSNNSPNKHPPISKTPTGTKKSSIKKWGDRFRYGFLTPDEEQLRNEDLMERQMDGDTVTSSRNSTFPVSLEPPTQAKLQSEIELYVTVTANRFLMKEAKAGRLSGESVSRLRGRWAKMGRPEVIEFHYDQTYQHELIYANISTVKFHGDAARDSTQVNSTLDGWRVMAREMSVRTFCCPDSVLRKHLHDAHRVLEILGAPLVTFLAYENMQIKSLQMITQRQKERMARKKQQQQHRGAKHARSFSDGATRLPSDTEPFFDPEYTAESFQLDRIRLSPTPSSAPGLRREVRKATGAEGAIMSLSSSPAMMRVRQRDHDATRHRVPKTDCSTSNAINEKPETLLL